MRVTFEIPKAYTKGFEERCAAIITKVGSNTRKGTEEACKLISELSLKEVPRETGTLASSQFWTVEGNYRTGWTGTVGYGGNGDPINPRTGKPSSEYMLPVHEDLRASHPVGKAKYLEDPMRRYARFMFPRTIFKAYEDSIKR